MEGIAKTHEGNQAFRNKNDYKCSEKFLLNQTWYFTYDYLLILLFIFI